MGALVQEIMAERPGLSIKMHDWWRAPKVAEAVRGIDPEFGHAGWMENFPWTRLAQTPAPEGRKPMVDPDAVKARDPAGARVLLGDGSFGGTWQKDDTTMHALWTVGVEETRAALEGPWGEVERA